MLAKQNQVFVISGINRVEGNSGGVEQIVVVAFDEDGAHALLLEHYPQFEIAGCSSLASYEGVVDKVRAVLRGRCNDWPLLIAKGMVV